MYYPVPGCTHLKVVVPRLAPEVAAPPRRPRPVHRAPRVSPLVRAALEASFGLREAATLDGELYGMGVRSHVSARRRASRPSAKEPVRVLTCHARESGEIFGSVQAGTRRFGYAARIKDGKLVSFKVL
ncbi:hypothetical protein CAPI_02335 [Corynebacterium capitovis DSM 44611]|uniref:hypothetical protein n=1 Tax=Corynebacterium capitovis TaxID=131081 RepID=UPI0003644EBB|nr:hypothetical protein [Corynebacterium capitovis]WKD57041.1 hypothetical protein CAPI_02335 [Corynebacterium capitovis DSM 44611]